MRLPSDIMNLVVIDRASDVDMPRFYREDKTRGTGMHCMR